VTEESACACGEGEPSSVHLQVAVALLRRKSVSEGHVIAYMRQVARGRDRLTRTEVALEQQLWAPYRVLSSAVGMDTDYGGKQQLRQLIRFLDGYDFVLRGYRSVLCYARSKA